METSRVSSKLGAGKTFTKRISEPTSEESLSSFKLRVQKRFAIFSRIRNFIDASDVTSDKSSQLKTNTFPARPP
jgi:hypothetical protein